MNKKTKGRPPKTRVGQVADISREGLSGLAFILGLSHQGVRDKASGAAKKKSKARFSEDQYAVISSHLGVSRDWLKGITGSTARPETLSGKPYTVEAAEHWKKIREGTRSLPRELALVLGDTLSFYLLIQFRLIIASAISKGSLFSIFHDLSRLVRNLERVHGSCSDDLALASTFYWPAQKYKKDFEEDVRKSSIDSDLRSELERLVSSLEASNSQHRTVYCRRRKKYIPAEEWLLSDLPESRKSLETVDGLIGLSHDLTTRPTKALLMARLRSLNPNKIRTASEIISDSHPLLTAERPTPQATVQSKVSPALLNKIVKRKKGRPTTRKTKARRR